jgi:hypothetical protein
MAAEYWRLAQTAEDEVVEGSPSIRPGDPMTLGNMRQLGVQRLVASYLNDAFSA